MGKAKNKKRWTQGVHPMSVDMWYVAPQTHLWCHTPHMLHIQVFSTLLICDAGGGFWPQDILGSKKPVPKKSGAVYTVAIRTTQNWKLAGQNHTLAASLAPCCRISMATAPRGPQDPT